jgi:hypothetical protein
MVLLRNVKLCIASIVYWCQKLIKYICFAQRIELGKNWFFYAESDLGNRLRGRDIQQEGYTLSGTGWIRTTKGVGPGGYFIWDRARLEHAQWISLYRCRYEGGRGILHLG